MTLGGPSFRGHVGESLAVLLLARAGAECGLCSVHWVGVAELGELWDAHCPTHVDLGLGPLHESIPDLGIGLLAYENVQRYVNICPMRNELLGL